MGFSDYKLYGNVVGAPLEKDDDTICGVFIK